MFKSVSVFFFNDYSRADSPKKGKRLSFQQRALCNNYDTLVPLAVTTFGAWEENAVINLKEISKQQAANQRIDGGKLLCHFFERLSVVLQRENGAMLIERSPLNNLPGHVDGAL